MRNCDDDPFDAEALRPPEYACAPDPRTLHLVVIDKATGVVQPTTLEVQHSWIAQYALSDTVPRHVKVSFETAKNLYLYAWFVFRFYTVAEQHALATLELALRARFPAEIEELFTSKGKRPPGLKTLLQYAKDCGVLANEKFTGARDRWTLELARRRYDLEIAREMQRLGVEEMAYDYSDVKPTAEELDYDWLGHFMSRIPAIRNDYAHGSSTLRHTVLSTFEHVGELINQLFPPDTRATADD
jgi:hypothetical protein